MSIPKCNSLFEVRRDSAFVVTPEEAIELGRIQQRYIDDAMTVSTQLPGNNGVITHGYIGSELPLLP